MWPEIALGPTLLLVYRGQRRVCWSPQFIAFIIFCLTCPGIVGHSQLDHNYIVVIIYVINLKIRPEIFENRFSR